VTIVRPLAAISNRWSPAVAFLERVLARALVNRGYGVERESATRAPVHDLLGATT